MTGALRLVAALLVAALLGVVAGSPAHADPQRLMLGLDPAGPFTESLSTPLFSGSYVPGTATSTFYVRNESPSTTRATIALVSKEAVNELERSLSFSATVGGHAGTGVPLHQDKKKNQCRTLATGPTVAPGGVQRVDVTMMIDPDLSRTAMNQSASFTFVVTLSQVTTKGKVDVCGTQSPGGTTEVLGAGATARSATVALTGSPTVTTPRSASLVAGVATAFLLSGGLLFLTARRRRRTP
jgi:hypothetical protein